MVGLVVSMHAFYFTNSSLNTVAVTLKFLSLKLLRTHLKNIFTCELHKFVKIRIGNPCAMNP